MQKGELDGLENDKCDREEGLTAQGTTTVSPGWTGMFSCGRFPLMTAL